MTDDDELAPVVPLPTATAGNRGRNAAQDEFEYLPLRSAPWSPETCKHRQSMIDVKARTLTCSRCGVPLDPFEVINKFARRDESYVESSQLLRRRIEQQHTELADLERKERNAKSRVRSARAKARRIDLVAVLAAAKSAEGIGGYRKWEELNEHQQQAVADRVERIIESYLGELEQMDVAVEQAG